MKGKLGITYPLLKLNKEIDLSPLNRVNFFTSFPEYLSNNIRPVLFIFFFVAFTFSVINYFQGLRIDA